MHHGFAAARGDWSDPLNVQRANEALSIVTTFFKSIFYTSASEVRVRVRVSGGVGEEL